MKKDVIISILGLQQADTPETDNVTLVTQGRYYRHGDKYFVSYDETELTGLDGTRTTLKIEDDAVTVLRTGRYPSQLVFQMGKKHTSLYNTDFGDLTISVCTRNIKKALTDSGGFLDVKYEVEIDHAYAGSNHLQVDIKEMTNSTEGEELQ